ncbi:MULTISPECIES: ASKHA domain-containing protein [unclassified Clostridium]|uniref:ASKHA domain-containing protein n=1 Tax=unclassified Clostridium TaxID=2614128 RepID=UPI0025B7C24C|nr:MULTISPECIES: ASKHA domain-containing protein [unclassified Clostridium]
MHKVYFNQYDKEIHVENGSLLIDVIRKNGFKLETPCNSKGICGKCKVKIYGIKSEPKDEEKKFLTNANERLACITKIEEDITVEFLTNEKEDLKTINEGYSIDVDINSRLQKRKFQNIKKAEYKCSVECTSFNIKDMDIIKRIGDLRKYQEENLYVVTFEDTIIDLFNENKNILGIALDIGTTGISSYLLDLENGNILNKASTLNPQTTFGGDVISRISFTMQEENGLDKLQEVIIEKINELIEELIGKKFNRDDIYNLNIAANTTMLHILAGVNPESIAKAPYKATFLDKIDLRPKELNIDINPKGIITLLPSISSYVGADIVAGIVAIDISKYQSVIFIDIGTNGEMVLLKDGKLYSTSTAAGPALEGMNISCGMRAESGAIEKFELDKNFNVSYSTIGETKARGICGSGLLDITSNLIKTGILEPSGRFSKTLPENIKEKFRDKKFYITEDIYISQKDIRQIQLAKGAIASGITMLLKEVDDSIENIDHAIIAGSFGYHLKEESIRTIGIIPNGFKGDIKFVGNSSVEGAKLSLLNKDKLLEMMDIKDRVEVVDLSSKDYFQKYFIEALNFN